MFAMWDCVAIAQLTFSIDDFCKRIYKCVLTYNSMVVRNLPTKNGIGCFIRSCTIFYVSCVVNAIENCMKCRALLKCRLCAAATARTGVSPSQRP